MAERSIAIFTDDPGWHGRRLREAFSERGYDSSYVSLSDCRIDLAGPSASIVIPGYEKSVPAGVFVRGVPGGTLDQVILRLDVLHALRDSGMVVYNNGRAIERTVDKAMTSFLLKTADIPSPDTWVCESIRDARKIVIRETRCNRHLVLKPLFGSQGEGITLIKGPTCLPDPEECGGVYYLQSLVVANGAVCFDWRVFVINGKARAAMLRRSDHWITNRAQGASCEAVTLDRQLAGLAEDAAAAVDIDYAGVDLLMGSDGGYMVTEVNSIPAWKGLQGVCHIDIADALTEHFFSLIRSTEQLQALP